MITRKGSYGEKKKEDESLDALSFNCKSNWCDNCVGDGRHVNQRVNCTIKRGRHNTVDTSQVSLP